MPPADKPVIYQLVVRYFGNVNGTNTRDGTLAVNGCGRFADINSAALSAIKGLGATFVWLTGCLRQATLTDYTALGLPPDDPDVVKGIAGSMYAVRDYFDVSPDYAIDPAHRLDEFDALVTRVHAAGMKVMTDLVPNHVARGYHSVVKPALDFGTGDDRSKFFARDNHFFYLVDPPHQALRLTRPSYWDPSGFTFDGAFPPEDGAPGRPPKATGDNCFFSNPTKDDWYETVKLNYGFNFADGSSDFSARPRTWYVVDEIIAYWQARGVNGFRCDMAYYVPRKAWKFLIGNARGRDPDVFFLAEAYPTGDRAIPIHDLNDLTAAGFDALYYSSAYDALKRIYQGFGSQDDYDRQVSVLSTSDRPHRLFYLEDHDERRVASPVVAWQDGHGVSPGESGFGSPDAGYQLAPVQFLASSGPVLLFNGQEVGEPGADFEGFSTEDGRTTAFDYWCMPEFARWVNGHAFDGAGLSVAQKSLRKFYADLLALCQDPSVRGAGYWGLKYNNRSNVFNDCPDDLYSFARFQDGSGRLLLVVANFRPNADTPGTLRIPGSLADAAGLTDPLKVRLIFNRAGAQDVTVATTTRNGLVASGFPVTVQNQSSAVYAIGPV